MTRKTYADITFWLGRIWVALMAAVLAATALSWVLERFQ
jgi:uncharacterized membrane protein